MKITSIKTEKINQNSDLETILSKYLNGYHLEGAIIAITSKIVSICEGRVVSLSECRDKSELIRKEADFILKEDLNKKEHILTIKNGILIPSAGIDRSNVKEGFVLYPKNIQKSCNKIWDFLRKKYRINNLGVIITDSRTTPMRSGVTGVCLSWCGFYSQHSYIGSEDLYGRLLECTRVNVVDSLAASAVFCMGEGPESTPIALIEGPPRIDFTPLPPSDNELKELNIPMDVDIYGKILKKVEWIKN